MAEDTRQRIIAATNELFRRRGYHATSLSAIAETAGAPTGSIYHFFPGGKVELAEAVIAETGEAYGQLFELITAGADGPVRAVHDFLTAAAEAMVDADFVDLCPIGTVAREVASENERLRLAADAVFTGWVDRLAPRFAEAGLGEPEARSLATTVVCLIEGGFVVARTRRDASVLAEAGHHAAAMVEAVLARSVSRR